MSQNAKVVMIKQVRCQILRNLDYVYPSGLVMRYLFETVCAINPMYDMSLLAKDMEYLKGKGYVEFVDEKIGGMGSFQEKVAVLTAEGKEVAEGTDTDGALEI